MASEPDDKMELETLRQTLMPVLEQAAIGYFETDLVPDPSNSESVNEILAGVQVLLEVIRERGLENERLVAELKQSRTPMGLLDELLDSSGGK